MESLGTLGPYELVDIIGKGGMAEVFRAIDRRENAPPHILAVKRLLPSLANNPHYVQLFKHEALLSSMLQHPNIVRVFESGTINGQHFMSMEYVEGRDLGKILQRCKQRNILLPIDFAIFLGVTLLEALTYAHNMLGPSGQLQGIVHRDVSPSNLFISRVGEIKLGDFGIAHARDRDRKEQNTAVWGKPYYLSPEALQGIIDPYADQWAATAVIYELLCNQRPFIGKNKEEVCAAIRCANPAPLNQLRSQLSVELNGVIMRGFALSPQERFPDTASFAKELRGLLDERIGTPLAIAAVVRGLFDSSV